MNRNSVGSALADAFQEARRDTTAGHDSARRARFLEHEPFSGPACGAFSYASRAAKKRGDQPAPQAGPLNRVLLVCAFFCFLCSLCLCADAPTSPNSYTNTFEQ